MFYQWHIVKGNNSLKGPRARYKVKILVFEKFTELISTSSFLILKKHITNEVKIKSRSKVWHSIKRVIVYRYKRLSKICMHVMLLPLKNQGVFFLFFLIFILFLLIAEFELSTRLLHVNFGYISWSAVNIVFVHKILQVLPKN